MTQQKRLFLTRVLDQTILGGSISLWNDSALYANCVFKECAIVVRPDDVTGPIFQTCLFEKCYIAAPDVAFSDCHFIEREEKKSA